MSDAGGGHGENLEPADAEIVERAAENAAEIVEQRLELTEHVGPLPSPETLGAYDDRFPGLGMQMVAWADSEIRHRQRLESDAIKARIKLASRGQIIGGAIAAGGFVLLAMGKSLEGFVVLTPVISAFVGAQYFAAKRRRVSREDKQQGP